MKNVERAAELDATDQEHLDGIAAAENELRTMGDGFRHEARYQLDVIQNAVHSYNLADDEDISRVQHTDTVFEASHELRGQAGTFGYGLLTELCDSLCTLIELEKKLDSGPRSAVQSTDSVWSAVVHHANAVTTIVEKDLKGDGGDWGRQLSAEVGRLRSFIQAEAA